MSFTSPRVIILLSTYNGERYLEEQLASLFSQTYQNLSLMVRDDGSTDRTRAILKKHAGQQRAMTVIEGNNIGVINSFYTLLQQSPSDSRQFYAFCDQDDLWKPDKIARAIARLSMLSEPSSGLYCSRLEYADSRLRRLGFSTIPLCLGFGNALVENSAIGCTVVFGDALKQKFLVADPNHMMMHDWWVYLLAAGFGEVLYDPEPRILYRQHSANTVGWDKRVTNMLKKSGGFLRNIAWEKQGLQCLRQAEHFLATYPELPEDKRYLLREFVRLRQAGNLFERYVFLKRSGIRRTHTIENLILILTILLRLH